MLEQEWWGPRGLHHFLVNQPFSTKCFLNSRASRYRFLECLELRKLGQINLQMVCPTRHREQICIRDRELIAEEEFVAAKLLLDQRIALVQIGDFVGPFGRGD